MNNRLLNRSIRKVERSLAQNLSKSKWSRNALENDLEWFVTWKIKQVTRAGAYWCDRAKNLELEWLSNKVLLIKAIIYIGPESDVSSVSEATLEGSLTLSSHGKRLKSYNLNIVQSGTTYVLSKKT